MPQIQMLQRAPEAPSFSSQLGAALGGGLSEGLSASLGSFLKQKQNRSALEGLKPIYEASGLPADQFSKFVNSGIEPSQAVSVLKALNQGQGIYRQAQQARLTSDSLMKQYATRIKEAQAMIESPYTTKQEREQARQAVNHLKAERDSIFGWGQPMQTPEAPATPQPQAVAPEPEKAPIQPKKAKGKPKFDNANPEHRDKAQKLFDKYKDKEQVRKALSKDFEF